MLVYAMVAAADIAVDIACSFGLAVVVNGVAGGAVIAVSVAVVYIAYVGGVIHCVGVAVVVGRVCDVVGVGYRSCFVDVCYVVVSAVVVDAADAAVDTIGICVSLR